MFRRFPVFERLITWTKPDAPFERGTREYEWYDHNSLLAEEPEYRALVPAFMDRSSSMPSRAEMEAGLRAFAERTGLEIRYGCRWEATRREEDGLVLVTSDGEYRCRAAVFAIGVTEPWKAPIPGVEQALHYVETGDPEPLPRAAASSSSASATRASRSRAGCSPWASQIVLASPSPVDTRYRPLAGSCAVSRAARRVLAGRRRRVRRRRRDRAHRADARRLPDRDARHDVGRGARFEVDKCSSRPASGLRCSTCPSSASRRSRTGGSRR